MQSGENDMKNGISLQQILSECALDNRLAVLGLMNEVPVSVADVRRALIKAGAEKSFATVKRYLDSLKKIGLVDEKAGRYRLTNLGFYISRSFQDIAQNISAINTRVEPLNRVSISYLPKRFIHGLKLLNSARFIKDPFSLITELLMRIQQAEESIDMLADRPSYQFFELVGNKVLQGVQYRGICSTGYAEVRQKYAAQFVSSHGLSGARLRSFRENFRMKEHPEVLMHAIVVDSRIAGINFPYRGGGSNLDSGFMSGEPEFVEWVGEIINYFWDRGTFLEF